METNRCVIYLTNEKKKNTKKKYYKSHDSN